jgi:methylglutaconyl-CoA hydratase
VSDVITRVDGPVATLTLNRPDRRNSLTPSLMAALADSIERVAGDTAVRVVVLTGAGPAFSAGADIEWMRESRTLPQERNLDDAAAMHAALEAVDACPKAVIARVHGAAIGGGAGLVACADAAVASDDARFAFSEARLGLLPALISPYVLRRIGEGHTRALFTTAATFDADEALRYGLVHSVVAPARLDAAVADAVAAVLECAPEAIAAVKELIRASTAVVALRDLPERIVAARRSAAGREGMSAFLEKRPPRWSASGAS